MSDEVKIESEDLIELAFLEFSLVFDPVSRSCWAELPDDEQEDIMIEEPGAPATAERLAQLPPIPRDGSFSSLTLDEFLQIKLDLLG